MKFATDHKPALSRSQRNKGLRALCSALVFLVALAIVVLAFPASTHAPSAIGSQEEEVKGTKDLYSGGLESPRREKPPLIGTELTPFLSSPSRLAESRVVTRRGVAPDVAASQCPIPSRTFAPLGTFQFWGKPTNASSPCPTAGLNNQLTMLFGLIHCSLGPHNNAEGMFKFKDITCSPTGGKDGRRQFRVGSDDYEYQWFRWSELFSIQRPAPDREICFADEHSWSEHRWMKKCPTTVDHIYGTSAFWSMRKSLRLHTWFDQFTAQFIRDHSRPTSTSALGALPRDGARGGGVGAISRVPSFLAIHVRRGDYENFCRQTAKSSGVRKFRTAPFVWLQRASEERLREVGLSKKPVLLSNRFMSSCFPDKRQIADVVARIVNEAEKTSARFEFLFVATNSQTFVADLKQQLAHSNASDALRALPVVTLRDYMDRQAALGDAAPHHQYWGRRARNKDGDDAAAVASAVITDTEQSLLDVNILSAASAVVLNKYSTFSQSVIDFRMLRDETLAGQSIYWW